MELSFEEFFRGLHGYDPFPWQSALAAKIVVDPGWPKIIDLPTGSGKTSCLDIAIYSMITSAGSPRRIFFVVDRRVVVNEAYERMKQIANQLKKPDNAAVEEAALRLRALSGGDDPLHVCEMRGGIYRDSSWVNNPLQPTVVLSTVDQVGSRLLFRGYGVSPGVRSIHAALIANDSLVILDEAHCSRPFAQTLGRVSKYVQGTGKFQVVEMTATPSHEKSSFAISESDRLHPVLSQRLYSKKRTKLVSVEARSDQPDGMAKSLVAEAMKLQVETGHKRIAIMANRIATAKAIGELLEKQGKRVHLLIGRMRPLDRDDLLKELAPFRTGNKDVLAETRFVVSTQCLEVGADLDFEVLVTEAASIDALLQRFGRMDRAGKCEGGARGAILLGQIKSGKPDAIYGGALEAVTQWLHSVGGEEKEVDMGIEGLSAATIPQLVRNLGADEAATLRQPTRRAAILLPAHIDALAQTNPEPEPSPDVSLFLHGSSDAVADVQVIWRADLPTAQKDWIEVLSLCPPCSSEAMPVRISAFRNWAKDQNDADIEGLEIVAPVKGKGSEKSDPYFVWQGEKSVNREVRPGDTVILRCEEEGWKAFGHIPVSGLAGSNPRDFGDRANFQQRRQAKLRISEELVDQWQPKPSEDLLEALKVEPGDPIERDQLRQFLEGYLNAGGLEGWQRALIESAVASKKPKLIPYPEKTTKSKFPAIVLDWRQSGISDSAAIRKSIDEDSGADELSYLGSQTLERHTEEVRQAAQRFSKGSGFEAAVCIAAKWHDFGKADDRFQTMLHGGDAMRAAMAPNLLAKGERYRPGLGAKAGLPAGFRHEMLSLAFATKQIGLDSEDRDLILHLIAAHHGHGRPYAPVVVDESPRLLRFRDITLAVEGQNPPAHNLSSGVSRRYWSLTRRLGWWRLAYVESLLRLADWHASAAKESE